MDLYETTRRITRYKVPVHGSTWMQMCVGPEQESIGPEERSSAQPRGMAEHQPLASTAPPSETQAPAPLGIVQAATLIQNRNRARVRAKNMEVFVRATIPRVLLIDMQNQAFTVQIKMEAQWHDADPDWTRVKKLLLHHDRKRANAVAHQKVVKEVRIPDGWFPEHPGNGRFSLTPSPTEETQFRERCSCNGKEGCGCLACDSLSMLSDKKFFSPRLTLTNMIAMQDEEKWYAVKVGGDCATVKFNWIFTGTFQHEFEMANFPFDEQNLRIILKTGWERVHHMYRVKLLRNQSDKSVIITRGFVQQAEYELQQHVRFTEGETSQDESSTGLK